MNRRKVLALTGGAAAVSLAGCAALTDDGYSFTATGDIAGQSARVSDVGQSVADELAVAAAIGVDSAYVRARDGQEVDVLTDGLGTDELGEALGDAGYDVERTADGVTDETRDAAVDALEAQLDRADVDGEVHFEDGSVVVEADEDVTDKLTADPETVAIKLLYPDPESDQHRQETVLTGSDIAQVSGVQQNSTGNPRISVYLTETAGERFATRLVETGFTERAGAGACAFDPESEAEPPADQYCILTATEREVVHAASLNPDLANTMESGTFRSDPAFVVTTAGDEERAEELADVLGAGLPPASVDFEQ